MRVLAVLAAALVFVPAASSWPNATLKITVWPKGKGGPSSTWTLRCDPRPRGTHPDPNGACVALARHARALRPVPDEIACIQRSDGPEVALVRGTFRGKRLRATFNRTDGCEIRRWNALAPLLPRD